VENFIAGSYRIAHQGSIGGQNDDLATQMYVMGLENVSSLANFAMGPRGSIPRNPIDNQRGSQGNIGNDFDFTVEHRAARVAMLGLERMQTLSLGSLARNARATAFARFVQGVAMGNLAMTYDSAMIETEGNNHVAQIPFSGYQAVDSAALADLDSAIAIAGGAAPAGPSSDWFPLPNTWLNGVAVSAAQFVQLCRSYKARLRAGVARNPTERAAVDWASVIADANAGITADFNITMSPSTGWDVVWPIQSFATGSANWHQMSQFILGMADSSGQYDAWLAVPRASRQAFTVYTKDARFPGGSTRALQQAATVAGTFTSIPYIRNRPTGEDQPGDPIGISQYDFYRSRAFYLANRIGTYPIMAKAEMDLLAAEGYLWTGNIAAAAAKIDNSRVGKGVLPSLVTAGIADTLTAVPGGASCVPRVPDPATTFTSSKCGNIWDAMRWEYWMETAFVGYGQWYIADRGWGALPEGTAIQWPVPYNEMDVRGQSFYSMGGVGGPGGSAAGIYGLHAGGVY
jgi:hypothetical protein